VLIVDDDRSTRSTLRYTCSATASAVEEAADGAQALMMLKRFQPDVILMDAVMPVMDGFTACARMQELPGGTSIPVLMITALEDNSSVERAFAAGASDYIPKPIHYAVLSQRVRRIIEANRAEKRIRHLAYNDLLTGLPNRTLFFDLLGQSVEQAGRQRAAGGAVHGPGPLQVRQRQPRPRRRRPPAGGGGPARAPHRAQCGRGGAPGRRRIHRGADRDRRPGAGRRRGAKHLPRAGRAIPDRRPRHFRHQQRRHRHVPARRHRRADAGQARRQRHVPRQENQHRLPVLRSVDGADHLRARAPGERFAPRA
jgi:CheY-like chemotaxis protein